MEVACIEDDEEVEDGNVGDINTELVWLLAYSHEYSLLP